MKDKIYLVEYSCGSWDDHYPVVVFATTKKSVATRYVTRFNRILKKWRKYYEQFEEKQGGISWVKDEHLQTKFERWYALKSINKCRYIEVEIR